MIRQFLRRLFRRQSGADRLQLYFSIDRAPWLTLPRVCMEAMPDEWQRDMAQLLCEWDDTWRFPNLRAAVNIRRADGSYAPMPPWLTNYRRPDASLVDSLRVSPLTDAGWLRAIGDTVWTDWCRRHSRPRADFGIDKASYDRHTRPITSEDSANEAQQVFVALDEEGRKQL